MRFMRHIIILISRQVLPRPGTYKRLVDGSGGT